MMKPFSNRALVSYLVVSDVLLLVGGAWLARFSLSAAADPRTSASFILVLLVANVALLLLLLVAASAATLGVVRLARMLSRVLRHSSRPGSS